MQNRPKPHSIQIRPLTDYAPALPPPSALLEFPFWFPERLTPLAVAAVDVAAFATVWAEITAEFHSRAAGYETVLRALLRVLFVRAHRLYEHQESVRDGKALIARDDSRLTRRFRLAVEDNFRRLAAVGDYARLLGVRPEHLSGSVLAATGRSAGELIRQRLLLEARRLLLHTGQTVAEIAYGLGFADPAYFSRFFRRASGQSPGEFRAECEAKYPY